MALFDMSRREGAAGEAAVVSSLALGIAPGIASLCYARTQASLNLCGFAGSVFTLLHHGRGFTVCGGMAAEGRPGAAAVAEGVPRASEHPTQPVHGGVLPRPDHA